MPSVPADTIIRVQCIQIVVTRKWFSMCTNCSLLKYNGWTRNNLKRVFNVYKLLSPENGFQCVQIVVTSKWCSMHTNRCHPKMVFNVYKLLLPENVVHCVQIVVTRKWCSMCKNHCHLKTMLNVNKLLSPENSVQRVQMVNVKYPSEIRPRVINVQLKNFSREIVLFSL